jgi:hypothetical protein
MAITRILGIVLLVLGILAVIYGGFAYTRETAEIAIGPLEMTVREQEQVNIPLWAGIAAIAGGVALILLPERREPRPAS